MTRAMLRRPFTAMRPSAAGANQPTEFYGKSILIIRFSLHFNTFFHTNI